MCDAPTKSGPPAKPKNGRVISLFAVMSMSFALLIWFKLRMVTGVPRTAYADPDPPQSQGLSQPLAVPPAHQPAPMPAPPLDKGQPEPKPVRQPGAVVPGAASGPGH